MSTDTFVGTINKSLIPANKVEYKHVTQTYIKCHNDTTVTVVNI